MTLQRWNAGGALAIDAITSALGKKAMRLESPCEKYGVTQKLGKYDKSFAETNYSFCAMVWETLGALNSEGKFFVRSFVLQPSSWVVSSARTVVALGHAFRAVCRDL